MLDTPGRIAGFYIHKATNKLGAPSRYWITDSGEVVKAFRYDTFGPEKGTIAEVGDKLADVVKTFKANESVVTEAKFVKEFDKGVLDAEYKADITTYYPSAEFFIGKMTHFFGQLEPNLFFKAYYAKYYKENTGNKIDGEFKITTVYSKKGSNYVNLYLEESANTVEAPKVNEAEVKSDEDFKEYAFAVLGKAFGDKFDEEKAQEVVDGLLSKHGEDYGAAVGALTASLG